jgi:hypothetical protein
VCEPRVWRDEPRVKPLGLTVFGVVDVWPTVIDVMQGDVAVDDLRMVAVIATLGDMKVLLRQECEA